MAQVVYIRPTLKSVKNKQFYLERQEQTFQDLEKGNEWQEYESQYGKLFGISFKLYCGKATKDGFDNKIGNLLTSQIKTCSPAQNLSGPVKIVFEKGDKQNLKSIMKLVSYINELKDNVYQEGLSDKKIQVFLKNAFKNWKNYDFEKENPLGANGKIQYLNAKDIPSVQDITDEELDHFKQQISQYYN